MPVHRNLLAHVEPAGGEVGLHAAHVALPVELEIVGEAADIADAGVNLHVVVIVRFGHVLPALRPRRVDGPRHGPAVHGRTDQAGHRCDAEDVRGEPTAHAGVTAVVLERDAVVELVVQLQLQRLGVGGDAVERLRGEPAGVEVNIVDVGVEHREVRGLARIEPGAGAQVGNLAAAQVAASDAALRVRFLGVLSLEQQTDVAAVVGDFLGDVTLDQV